MDERHRLYGDLAHLWPLMSPPDHYKDEARYWLPNCGRDWPLASGASSTWVPEAATTTTTTTT